MKNNATQHSESLMAGSVLFLGVCALVRCFIGLLSLAMANCALIISKGLLLF